MLKKLSKKMIIIALCLLLGGVCVLAGCGTKYLYEIDWNVDLNNKPTMNLLFPTTGMGSFGKDHSADIIERATGYKATYVEIPDSGADNEINNALSSQKPYHFMKITEAQFHPYVSTGGWLDLTELLKRTESGRRLYQIIDMMPGAWDSVTYTDKDGKTGIYGIPDCGFSPIEEFALVWNTKHLEEVGWYDNHTEVPATIGEVTEALRALQNTYGSNDLYHSFGIGRNSANVENIMAAFDCPNQFYVDENGDIQFYIYDESIDNYVKYMNTLKNEGIISDSWKQDDESGLCNKFAAELNSCVYIPYWWFAPLCDTIASNKLPGKFGLENTYEAARDELLAYRTRVRGDGTNGSKTQEKARYISDQTGCAWYTAIPRHMAKDAVYIIDYLGKKLEAFGEFYGGEEGVDWEVIDEPADKKEDPLNGIIYMKAWDYSYKIQDENGVESVKRVRGGGQWVKLLPSYKTYIVNNSQYATGTNVHQASSLFHFREVGFDAWPVAVEFDESIITNPVILKPLFDWWSPISILSRSEAKQGLGAALSAPDNPLKVLNDYRNGLKSKFSKKEGVKYFYWSDDISAEMTKWYKEVKLGQNA